jgi:hypothetical protein
MREFLGSSGIRDSIVRLIRDGMALVICNIRNLVIDDRMNLVIRDRMILVKMEQDTGERKKNQLNGESMNPGLSENRWIVNRIENLRKANRIKNNKQGKKKPGNESNWRSREICFEQDSAYKRNQDPEERR